VGTTEQPASSLPDFAALNPGYGLQMRSAA